MGEHGHHSPKPYIKVYFWLLGLFAVSVMGPVIADMFFESETGYGYTVAGTILVLTTAFGIAIVKAYLVASRFMHLNVEKPIVWYILTTCLVFMVLLFAAVSPDVQNHSGDNWVNVGAKSAIERGIKQGESQLHHGHGEGHGEDHGEGHGEDHGEGHDDAHKSDGHEEKEGAEHH